MVQEIEIFDSTFVNENIFSGNNIEHDHKKNLYNFVIGDGGVRIAEEMDQIDAEMKSVSKSISDKRTEIEEKIAWIGSVENFIALERVEDVDEKIRESQTQIDLLENVDNLNKKAILTCLLEFTFPDNFQSILLKTLSNISKDAERKTKNHVHKCMGDRGEVWIQEGLSYLTENESCPFCGQTITTNDLLTAYNDYFNEEYVGYKQELVDIETEIGNIFSQGYLLQIQKGVEQNSALYSDWNENIALAETDFTFPKFTVEWNSLHGNLINSIKRKQAQPLDDVLTKEEIDALLSAKDALIAIIETYNQWVDECNTLIDEFKKSITLGNLDEARKNHTLLKAQKTRYQPEIDKLCNEYKDLVEAKENLALAKKEKRDELRNFSEAVLDCCAESINAYLTKFGAGFRLSKIKPSFVGGKPSTSYELIINEVAIPLGSTDTTDLPSFKSVLSDGDKNALAFAFFLSKLDHDPNIGDKIVIFDDPITSFGLSRKTSTKQAIIKMTKKAKQVIVLSHDMHFLKMIFDDSSVQPKNLKISKNGNQSCIEEWDIACDTQSEYFRTFEELVRYAEESVGSPRLIVKGIRPLLEGNLRFRFPREFLAKEWLGDFLKKIRESSPGDSINRLGKHLEELSDINDYSSKYHHQQNPNADAEPIHEDELKAYVIRTLAIVSS